jgi:hypothetical protein
MAVSRTGLIAVWRLSLLLVIPAYAQDQQDAAKMLNGMPPDILAKVQSLAHILHQGLSEGKLTENEISRGLISGQLNEKLKQLNPNTDLLLHDISEASKQENGPGEESLLQLLGELGISSE